MMSNSQGVEQIKYTEMNGMMQCLIDVWAGVETNRIIDDYIDK